MQGVTMLKLFVQFLYFTFWILGIILIKNNLIVVIKKDTLEKILEFIENITMDKKTLIALGVLVYLISSFSSYVVFQARAASDSSYSAPVYENGELVDNDPKTEPCPLNGQLYSKSQREKWKLRRPLGIMVQNNSESRPQSGLSSADIVHEAVAEGGITRFLTIYYCEDPKIVGSVRSARIYFVKLLQGFGEYPLYAHVGGANTPGPADALGEIKDLDWYLYNDLDQFAVPFPNYWRDYDRLPGRATEHTVYTNTQKLWAFAKKSRDLTNVDENEVEWSKNWEPWKFVEDARTTDRGTVKSIKYGFWDDELGSAYTVSWAYDSVSNIYKRSNGGEPHIDLNTKEQLSAKNVIVVFADETAANDGYEGGQHLLYDVVGSDDVIIFKNGKAIKGTWEKLTEEDMMRFYDDKGDEVSLVSGKIWISILPTGNKVDYQSKLPSPKK
ncbi:hypothetical protein COV58_02465 [Candidatus Roizmanbacteria bacterium CG11_big_fil_rev_8_21_14_0_20_36_8]|uniref:DUF3048 domain-containing protein n=2 Tax=Candidatus Roizmaniibacteriota TaxID=1752723 RepID=A0A2M6IU21_9BACT|nr:MAG: hypothetical protein COV58_02465 [Candidatus Roizmanbacteria bacterium CG11_big_fil_rev_8_21_14_0_20_36_8]PIZ66243.1 MAG: hypothetical protein COY14_00680 [Candidatus Roizmanbacteria bacterium CG_4_10_14_0_2_um_filter_36_9]